MKIWNIVPKEIEIAGSKISAIRLGESGRGRKEKLIRCPMVWKNLVVKAPKQGMPGNVRLVDDVEDKEVSYTEAEILEVDIKNSTVSSKGEFIRL